MLVFVHHRLLNHRIGEGCVGVSTGVGGIAFDFELRGEGVFQMHEEKLRLGVAIGLRFHFGVCLKGGEVPWKVNRSGKELLFGAHSSGFRC